MIKQVILKSHNGHEAKIGGGAPVTIQSMCTTDTADATSTIKQIQALESAGCEIVRVSVYDMECAKALRKIVSNISIPLVADIHFDHKLAIASIENGAAKIRINPGNIGSKEKVKELVSVAKEHNIPIRIGVNGGSLEKTILAKYEGVTAEGMLESAKEHIDMLEELYYDDIIVSLKASTVALTVKANRLFREQYNYPLHLGVTEAGFGEDGIVKSAVGIGSLLLDGIGETIRVSLTGNPISEIVAGKNILRAAGLKNNYIDFVACPTCARTSMNVETVAKELKDKYKDYEGIPLTVAVMGCVVNGPGEAKEADLGVAGGKDSSAIFKKGKLLKTVKNEDVLSTLSLEIDALLRG